jgi:hypothetical protein
VERTRAGLPQRGKELQPHREVMLAASYD